MRILALDASTKSTGVAVFIDKELAGVKCVTASSTDLYNRIHKITDAIDHIIETVEIDEIVMEEVIPDHDKNTNTFKALMYLQASIMMMIHDKHPKVKVTLVYPGSWRSQCGIKTGKGVKRETLKEADIIRAKELFALTKVNDDEADACLIGAAYVGLFGSAKQEDNDLNWGV